jgi:hypothetical protein
MANKRIKIFIFSFWAHFLSLRSAQRTLRAGNRAIRLYLFRLRQKRIPLLSLARPNGNSHLALGVLRGKTPGNFPLRGGWLILRADDSSQASFNSRA